MYSYTHRYHFGLFQYDLYPKHPILRGKTKQKKHGNTTIITCFCLWSNSFSIKPNWNINHLQMVFQRGSPPSHPPGEPQWNIIGPSQWWDPFEGDRSYTFRIHHFCAQFYGKRWNFLFHVLHWKHGTNGTSKSSRIIIISLFQKAISQAYPHLHSHPTVNQIIIIHWLNPYFLWLNP